MGGMPNQASGRWLALRIRSRRASVRRRVEPSRVIAGLVQRTVKTATFLEPMQTGKKWARVLILLL